MNGGSTVLSPGSSPVSVGFACRISAVREKHRFLAKTKKRSGLQYHLQRAIVLFTEEGKPETGKPRGNPRWTSQGDLGQPRGNPRRLGLKPTPVRKRIAPGNGLRRKVAL